MTSDEQRGAAPSNGQYGELRARAEVLLAGYTGGIRPVSRDDLDRVLHELHVYEVELKLQNEELRRAQGQLEAVCESYSDLYERAPVGYVTLSREGVVLKANLAAAGLLGRARGNLLGTELATEIYRTSRGALAEHLHQVFGGPGRAVIELRLRQERDATRWLRLESVLATSDGEHGPCCRMAMSDVTERIEADAARRESEARAAALLEATPDAVWIIDADGTVLACSREAAREQEAGAEDLRGRNLWQVLPAAASDFRRAAVDAARRAGRYQRLEEHNDAGWRDVVVYPVPGTGGQRVETAIWERDITEQKRIQRELLQAQKMEAIGRLAGGVAHDMNNTLACVMGLASLHLMDPDMDATLRQDLQDVLTACDRGRELVRNLLGFARRGQYRRETFCPAGILTETATVLRRTIAKTLSVQTRIEDPEAATVGDPDQIQQALMNLCINAVDAMEGTQGGGVLSLSLSTITLVTSDVLLHPPIQPGRFVRIQVEDTGCGMDATAQQRAFEPFFTTKPVGKGTGLGLSMVHGVVEAHGGLVTLNSCLGRGTTVSLYLPAMLTPRVAAQGDAIPGVVAYDGGMRTVLLVDDEQPVLLVGARLLAALGHRVLAASSGPEALSTCAAQGNEIDLVILDLTMPGMDGAQTARALRASHPELKILLSSGHSSDGGAEKLLREGCVGFLQKPYGVSRLIAALTMVFAQDDAAHCQQEPEP